MGHVTRAEALAREVEEVQAEVVGYSRQVEAAREEVGNFSDHTNLVRNVFVI